jgi:hypothetical protein
VVIRLIPFTTTQFDPFQSMHGRLAHELLNWLVTVAVPLNALASAKHHEELDFDVAILQGVFGNHTVVVLPILESLKAGRLKPRE